jgi:Delta24-sterol reductase
VQRFSGTTDPWFYLHVQDKIRDNTKAITEAIQLPEYLFRYDRGGFWVGRASFNYFPGVPFNKLTRWFLDDFLHTRMLYKALHASGQSERMIIQDLALPYDNAEEFINFTHHRLGIWPLWLCPLKQSSLPTMHPHLAETEADGSTLKPMLNIGLWGDAAQIPGGFVQANRDIESKLKELKGMKWLYAQTFCSEDEFWEDFDKEAYDELRRRYRAETLPSVYDKVKRKDEGGPTELSWSQWAMSIWPLPGIVGIVSAIQSGDYLLARNAAWKRWNSEDCARA